LRNGELDVVLSIPADFAETFSTGRPAKVEMIVNESQDRAGATVARVQQLLERYSRQTALLRLVARGVNPDLVRVIKIETRDLAKPQQQGAGLLKLAVGYGLFAAFVGAMSIMIDVTAGERERGSLEPLIDQSRRAMAAGDGQVAGRRSIQPAGGAGDAAGLSG